MAKIRHRDIMILKINYYILWDPSWHPQNVITYLLIIIVIIIIIKYYL